MCVRRYLRWKHHQIALWQKSYDERRELLVKERDEARNELFQKAIREGHPVELDVNGDPVSAAAVGGPSSMWCCRLALSNREWSILGLTFPQSSCWGCLQIVVWYVALDGHMRVSTLPHALLCHSAMLQAQRERIKLYQIALAKFSSEVTNWNWTRKCADGALCSAGTECDSVLYRRIFKATSSTLSG